MNSAWGVSFLAITLLISKKVGSSFWKVQACMAATANYLPGLYNCPTIDAENGSETYMKRF